MARSFFLKLKGYDIRHHYIDSTIDLEVGLDFKSATEKRRFLEYSQNVLIHDAINNYLSEYPNEDDFWEILNKNLITELLTESIFISSDLDTELRKILKSISIQINIDTGVSGVDFPRSSLVKVIVDDKNTELQERFSFKIDDYSMKHNNVIKVIDLQVDLDFREGIGENTSLSYPNIEPIKDTIEKFLEEYPNENGDWKVLNRRLATELMSKTIYTLSGNEIELNRVLDSISIQINVEKGLSMIQKFNKVTVLSQDSNLW